MDRTGPLHAYLDESRLRIGDGPENLYLMVAVVVAGVDRLVIQDRLRSVRPPGFKRLHFRDDQRAVQRRHVTLLRELHEQGVIHAVEAHARIPRARREQAGRNRCLSALAGHLAAAGVSELIIESRQEHQDQRDRRILHAGRDNGVVPPDLQWRFGRPKGEPLLWAADAIAGIIAHEHVGRPTCLGPLIPPGLRECVWSGGV